jgi:hypothetical protein
VDLPPYTSLNLAFPFFGSPPIGVSPDALNSVYLGYIPFDWL